jgi:hypothetical protein
MSLLVILAILRLPLGPGRGRASASYTNFADIAIFFAGIATFPGKYTKIIAYAAAAIVKKVTMPV